MAFEPGFTADAAVADDSCNGFRACAFAGYEGRSDVGTSSCNGEGTCKGVGERGSSSIGNFSCNGDGQCVDLGSPGTSVVGSCELNLAPAPAACADQDGDGILDAVDACVDEPEDPDGVQDEDGCPEADPDAKPVVAAEVVDESTGAPYAPGTWTQGPVAVRFTCTDDQGVAVDTYPELTRVQHATTFDLRPDWTCVDTAGNQADSPPGFPVEILVDKRLPRCSIQVTPTSVPRKGMPTPVTATVVGADDESGVATARIVAITPSPSSGPALPVDGSGTWILVGASGPPFLITGEVTDLAGNVRRCSERVTVR